MTMNTPGSSGSESRSLTLIQLRQIAPDRFEHLIGKLVEKMGYHATVTQYSADGGIDVIATKTGGITSERVLIQAKRYSGTVGVPQIRDLYGVLSADQEATSAVVITTGNFSAQAREFAEGKRIELIDGDRLLKILDAYNIVNVPSRLLRKHSAFPATKAQRRFSNRRLVFLIVIGAVIFLCICCGGWYVIDTVARDVGLLATYTPVP
jgi:hypothetical protein